MMKKLFAICLVLLTGVVLTAQVKVEEKKPLDIIVFDDITGAMPEDNDDRTRQVIQEYFKAELATHSGINIIQPSALSMPDARILMNYGFKRNAKPEAAQVAKLCKDMKAAFCCFISILRKGEKKLEVTVTVYGADGALKAKLTRMIEQVLQADYVSILLARDAAVSIRGVNPVDDLNLNRMKKRLDDLADQRIKKNVQKNIKATK